MPITPPDDENDNRLPTETFDFVQINRTDLLKTLRKIKFTGPGTDGISGIMLMYLRKITWNAGVLFQLLNQAFVLIPVKLQRLHTFRNVFCRL